MIFYGFFLRISLHCHTHSHLPAAADVAALGLHTFRPWNSVSVLSNVGTVCSVPGGFGSTAAGAAAKIHK